MANSSIDLVKLNDSLGAYCRNNTNVLLSSILVGSASLQHFTPMVGVKDQAPIIDLQISDILKPYSKNWTPNTDAINPNPRIMQVRTCKVELELEPLAYHHTYLGLFLKPGTDPANLPFEKFLMDKIAQSARQQLELQGIFKGVYNAAGTTPGSTIDGLNTIAAAEITGGGITPHVTGVITAANAVEKLEAFFYSLPEEYQAEPMKLFVSPQIKAWYNQGYRAAYGNVTHNTEFNKQYIDGTQCEIVAMPGLAGSQRLHLAPAWNVFYGTDLVSDMDVVRTQLDKWVINVMMSFKVGVQVGSLEYYWTNDQA